MLLVLVSVAVLLSPSMCLDDNELGLGSCVAIFGERAAHSVYFMLSLYFDYNCNFSYFTLRFLRRECGSDCISSWSWLTFYF